MAILPEGFTLPPPAYLAVLIAGIVVVALAVRRRRPAVTSDRVLAFTPWMVLGSALHVLYVVDALPAAVRPLAGTPAVYLTVAVVGVGTVVVADARLGSEAVARALALTGGGLALLSVVGVFAFGAAAGSLSPGVSAIALVAAALLAAAVWKALTRAVPEISRTGALGALAVFAHVLDGVSTAAGIDILGFGERTPLSRIIIEVAAGLPTEPVLGSGWLFVLVKIGVASLVLWLFADLAAEDPTGTNLLLGVVAAVGLGPAVHNLLLFAVSGPA
ncbi:DUF63 family protein [Halobellus sp. GM3]|uniref:DUF63 family protein n=1 Tax=Halobellus sp. GM3 TaxID=3458410 RepID=UPI00403D810C